MFKQSKWLLFALVIFGAVISFFIFNSAAVKNKAVVDKKELNKINPKNLDSLTIEEIRARYINNPCYLALLKDPNMWDKGTRQGFDYKDLINDSLPSNNSYKNRFIVGDFNSTPIDGKKTGIYEIYPSLTSLSEFKSYPKELLEKLDTIVYSEKNLNSVYAEIKTKYGAKGERLINFIEKVWKYKIIPISREYSINGDKVYAAGQVLVLCEACDDTLKLVGKFATSAKRQDFMIRTDANGNKYKSTIEYAPIGNRRGYYAGLNRITSKNWETERTYDSLDIERDKEVGGGNNRITIYDRKVELPNFLLMQPDKSYPKSMRQNGIHEIALNYLPRGMLGTPNSIGCLRVSDFGSKFFRWWVPQNAKLFIAYNDSLYLKKHESNPIAYLPFKNQTEGDKFRKWINTNYPDFAKRFDISIDGDYKNGFIIDGYYFFKKEYDNYLSKNQH
jgi:hypothetical protein